MTSRHPLPWLLAALSWAFPWAARAQGDPFASLTATGTCDDIAAVGAASAFHTFALLTALVAALGGVALWWVLERGDRGTWGGRTGLAAAAAGGLALGVVAANPLASAAGRQLMATTACQHHFWMAAMGPTGQGLVLGFLPAAALSVLGIILVRRLV